MASIGDQVMYNEGDANVDAWAYGVVVMTDTDPTGEEIAAAVAEFSNYPTAPPSGSVLVCYQGLVGNTYPLTSYEYASEGTGPGQYQALA